MTRPGTELLSKVWIFIAKAYLSRSRPFSTDFSRQQIPALGLAPHSSFIDLSYAFASLGLV